MIEIFCIPSLRENYSIMRVIVEECTLASNSLLERVAAM